MAVLHSWTFEALNYEVIHTLAHKRKSGILETKLISKGYVCSLESIICGAGLA